MAIWNEDFSAIYEGISDLRNQGVNDLEKTLDKNPDLTGKLASKIKVINVNGAAVKMFESESKTAFLNSIEQSFGEGAFDVFRRLLIALWNGDVSFRSEAN